ncbi:phage terminase large subunit family protein [Paracidovorax wautersii]|uniref:Phage terminase, large subunit GpA n=1 Tax=Paracidovorax wautersii TaxID=1177982 RepID=A0A1I2E7I9_9BURK|nr:phage terminase large subunit family protein [Paracidovorax wautersii]SFE88589.1 Phage terminase, large subunit GpA [Paracidovorax wautersii]
MSGTHFSADEMDDVLMSPDELARAAVLLARMKSRFFAPPPRVNTAEWADEFRHVAKGPERGRWRNSRTPYLIEPMVCASAHSAYERVALMFATQLGKSEVLYNALLQRIHTDPQDMMMVQPTLQDGQDHSSKRFLPTVLQTPILDGLVTTRKSRDESSSWRSRNIQGGFSVFFAGANSASSLASKPLGFAVADEVDLWPVDVDNQGPPLGLLEERMSNFSRRKLLIASTPGIKGQSVIEAEFMASDRRRYFVPCPHCGHMQLLLWGEEHDWGIKCLKTLTGEPRPETAVYICCNPECGGAIEEHSKTGMLADGLWRAEVPGAGRGKRAGFTLNKLYSPLGWKSWAALVEERENALAKQRLGETGPIRKFTNASMAQTFKIEGVGTSAEALSKRAEDYPLGIVPRGGLMLTMGVDTQPDRLEARIWAFGRGEESWLIQRHIIYGDPNLDENTPGSPWTKLTEIRRTFVPLQGGGQMQIEATGIDTGGHNTHAVYNYCREHDREEVLAIKGSSEHGQPVLGKPKAMDVNWRGRALSHGVKLWFIGTDTAKDLLFGRMKNQKAGPGYIHVPKALVETDEFEQMTNPRLMPKGRNGKTVMVWDCPAGKREEASDCYVYAYAMACYLGVETFREPSWKKREERYWPRTLDMFSQPDAPQPAEGAAQEDEVPAEVPLIAQPVPAAPKSNASLFSPISF